MVKIHDLLSMLTGCCFQKRITVFNYLKTVCKKVGRVRMLLQFCIILISVAAGVLYEQEILRFLEVARTESILMNSLCSTHYWDKLWSFEELSYLMGVHDY